MGKNDILEKQVLAGDDERRDIINLALPGTLGPDSTIQSINPEEVGSFFDDQPITWRGKRKLRKMRPWLAAIQRLRDLLFDVSFATDGKWTYAFIGVDNQSELDRSMPARVAIMDVLNYAAQLEGIAKKNTKERKKWQLRRKKNKSKGEEEDAPSEPRMRPVSWREMVSGMRETDMLKPVITIIVYWSPEPWTGPRRLHELMEVPKGWGKYMVSNELLIIEPYQLTDEEIASCKSELELVFKALKYALDGDALKEVLADARYRSMEPATAHLLAAVMGLNIELPTDTQEGERIDMVQGMLELIDKRAEEKNNEMLDLLEKSGDLAPETVSSVREKEQITTERIADLVHQKINSVEQQLTNAEQQTYRAAQELLNKGMSLQDVADVYHTTVSQVLGWMEKIQQTPED